jgi:hypothetical protein
LGSIDINVHVIHVTVYICSVALGPAV